MPSEIITTEQAAEILGISPRSVNALRRKRKIRYLQVNSRVFKFYLDDILRYRDSITVEPRGLIVLQTREQKRRQAEMNAEADRLLKQFYPKGLPK